MYRESAPDFSPIFSKPVVTTGGRYSILFELDELPDGTDQTYEFRYLIGRLSVAVAKQVLVISKNDEAKIETRQSELSVKREMKRSVVTVVSPVAVQDVKIMIRHPRARIESRIQRFDRYQN